MMMSIADLCAFGLKDQYTARPLIHRLVKIGNLTTNKSSKICRGHGKIQHLQRKGRLKDGTPRKEIFRYDCNSHSRKYNKDVYR